MKKWFKNLLLLLLTVVLAFSLVACSDEDDDDSDSKKKSSKKDTKVEETVEVEEDEKVVIEDEKPAEPVKPVTPPQTGTSKNDPELEEYIRTNGTKFAAALEGGFEQGSGGMDCDAKFRVQGTSLIVDVLINGIDNVSSDVKAQMQTAYDQSKSTFKTALSPLQKEAPNLTDVLINVCEEDGGVLATIELNY